MTNMEILSTTRRISYSVEDLRIIVAHVLRCTDNGLDLAVEGASSQEDVMEMIGAGYLSLQSRELKADIVLVNADAGKGFFGGQKTQILTFTSDIYRNDFHAGPVLGSLIRALVGINNMYRGAGLLKGGSF